MWRPARELAERIVAVRVLSPLPRGGHGVISYNSKLAKGRLAARAAAACGRRRASRARADDVAAAWIACGGRDAVTTPTGFDLYTA